MPTVPIGVLYFGAWKYGLYGALLVIGAHIFKYLGVFDIYPFGGIVGLSALVLLPVGWFEYGDDRLRDKWGLDEQRSNCDGVAKSLFYVCCCIVWPKFIMTGKR